MREATNKNEKAVIECIIINTSYGAELTDERVER